MKNIEILLALYLSLCFRKVAATNAETVWLRDVTKRLQTNKRGVTDPDLPDQLSFHLKSSTHDLVLNLRRNYQIDPNADIFIVKTLNDGRSVLEKDQISEMGDVAYYQDFDNGAFMTARCVKRSSGQCDILINGNIRLGHRNYNLRPSEVDVIQNDFLDIIGLRGRRYVLQDQENVKSGMSVGNNEQTNVDEKNQQDKYLEILRHITYGQDKRYPSPKPVDKTRNRKNYYVEVVAAADTSVWDLFYAITSNAEPHQRDSLTRRSITEYLLHVINGVDQMYNSIDDPSISIRVSIRAFVIWPVEKDFTHIHSKVHLNASGTMIDGDKYLEDLKYWDAHGGPRDLPAYDQVILFTKHKLLSSKFIDYEEGRSVPFGVCDAGRRVQIVNVADFFSTTRSTAHGLGHSLGSLDDGEDPAYRCRSNDKYIMARVKPAFYHTKRHNPDHWRFSLCSVEAFKKSLVTKTCLNNMFVHDQNIQDEMREVLRQKPGERYSPNEQCVLINGIGSNYSGQASSSICAALRCTLPATGKWDQLTVSAAPGTGCGNNKHCHEGMCVDIQ